MQYWRVKDDPILYPDFVNDSLAECSDITVKTPEPHVLARRAEPWTQDDARIPQGVIFTTHATDVQGNRIESALVGWGKNDEAGYSSIGHSTETQPIQMTIAGNAGRKQSPTKQFEKMESI
jgi:hypothetical protein